MKNSGEDAVGALILLGITLSLCLAVLFLGLVFLILVALLFLWWVLTYWLLRIINEVLTDNLVTESEGLLALIVPSIFWSILVGLLFPRPWIWLIATYLGVSTGKTWLYLVVGTSLISLGFGFLSLMMLEGGEGETTPTLDEAGMLSLPAGNDHRNGAADEWDFIREGVLLGEEI